jgi:hypothetical protein
MMEISREGKGMLLCITLGIVTATAAYATYRIKHPLHQQRPQKKENPHYTFKL